MTKSISEQTLRNSINERFKEVIDERYGYPGVSLKLDFTRTEPDSRGCNWEVECALLTDDKHGFLELSAQENCKKIAAEVLAEMRAKYHLQD